MSPHPIPTARTSLSRQGGFTILELWVSMVIIGMLTASVGTSLFGRIGKPEVKVTRAQIDGFATSLDKYRIDTGH